MAGQASPSSMRGLAGAPTGGAVPATRPNVPLAPTPGFNVNTASAGGLQSAMAGTQAGMGYNPQQVQAGQVANTNLQQYQNPYTQQVIDTQAQDVLRNAQLGLNQLGAQAQRAGAFGGSRHGVAMGEIGRGVAQTLGQQSAQLRQAGFQNAQQMAQQDIASRMQADLANQQAGLSGAQMRLGASAQMGDLSNLGFGMGQTINQNMMQQGAMQRALNQQLIDVAQQRYAERMGLPQQTIGYVSQALGASPIPQSQTTTKQPGLFDYLTLGTTAYGYSMSDIRLKKDIEKVGKLKNGLNIYMWKWKDSAKGLGLPLKTTIGVIAQEVQKLKPEAVKQHKSGYLMVDYGAI